MYRFDGYHNEKDIVHVMTKLLRPLPAGRGEEGRGGDAEALDLELIQEVPDIMEGRRTFNRGTEEEIFRQTRHQNNAPTFRDGRRVRGADAGLCGNAGLGSASRKRSSSLIGGKGQSRLALSVRMESKR